MLLSFATHQHHSWHVVGVSGDVDLSNAEEVKNAIETAMAAGAKEIVVDLRQVGFMDSTGLRVMIESHEKLEADGGKLAIVASEGPIERLFEITALHRYLSVSRDLPGPA